MLRMEWSALHRKGGLRPGKDYTTMEGILRMERKKIPARSGHFHPEYYEGSLPTRSVPFQPEQSEGSIPIKGFLVS